MAAIFATWLLTKRKRALEKNVNKAQDHRLRFSEHFDDGVKLLACAERMGLEGIVSKRRDAPYRSGPADWIKVKSASWREQNKDRHELFDKRR
jgi:bifunctional non-homologous end joining protein LigD